jgi:hypothetical protein
MFLTEQFIEKLFYFLERPLGTARVHEWRENYKLVLVWEHQGVRLGRNLPVPTVGILVRGGWTTNRIGNRLEGL